MKPWRGFRVDFSAAGGPNGTSGRVTFQSSVELKSDEPARPVRAGGREKSVPAPPALRRLRWRLSRGGGFCTQINREAHLLIKISFPPYGTIMHGELR